MLAKAVILGRVGKDPELTYLPNGTACCKFSVACNKKSKGETTTTWFNVTIFRESGENAAKYITKGSILYVEGDIESKAYLDKNGQPVASMSIIAKDWRLANNKSEEQSNSQAKAATADQSEPVKGYKDLGDVNIDDELTEEDIPF